MCMYENLKICICTYILIYSQVGKVLFIVFAKILAFHAAKILSNKHTDLTMQTYVQYMATSKEFTHRYRCNAYNNKR